MPAVKNIMHDIIVDMGIYKQLRNQMNNLISVLKYTYFYLIHLGIIRIESRSNRGKECYENKAKYYSFPDLATAG